MEVAPNLHSQHTSAGTKARVSASSELPTHPLWYAAYTSPRHEKSVAKQLEERRIDYFLPTYHSVRRWKDRRKEVDLVLFPGYVFVHIPLSDRLQVLQLPGVVRFVNFHGLPAALPENEIEALRSGLQNQIRMKSHPYLKVGRRVQVKNGPMAGVQGILARRKQNCRLIISLDAIMRSVALEIAEEDVEPLR
jgi:transcription antitermination factor NusG